MESIVGERPVRGRPRAMRPWLACAAVIGAMHGGAGPAVAASPPSVYLVAKYPVQAQAADAVTAKAQAGWAGMVALGRGAAVGPLSAGALAANSGLALVEWARRGGNAVALIALAELTGVASAAR